MGKKLEELEAILKICRKAGILYFRNESFEFRFSKSALRKNKHKEPDEAPRVTGVPSAEQMLHYSSFPHMG